MFLKYICFQLWYHNTCNCQVQLCAVWLDIMWSCDCYFVWCDWTVFGHVSELCGVQTYWWSLPWVGADDEADEVYHRVTHYSFQLTTASAASSVTFTSQLYIHPVTGHMSQSLSNCQCHDLHTLCVLFHCIELSVVCFLLVASLITQLGCLFHCWLAYICWVDVPGTRLELL